MRDNNSVVMRGMTCSPWFRVESESWRLLTTVCGMPVELGVSSAVVVMRGKEGHSAGGAGVPQVGRVSGVLRGAFSRGKNAEV